MMEFIEIAKNRYTTKKYNSSKEISESDILKLKEILQLSPSSINSQPWQFTFVSNKSVKNRLAEVSYFNEDRIKDASHLVVFSSISNIEKFETQIQENLPAGAVGYYNQFIKPQTNEQIQSWLSYQVYLSLGFFLSGCATMNIDSTPMEGINSNKYSAILKLKDYKPLFAVAIGYRDVEDSNQPSLKTKSRLNIEEVIKSI